jgi:hypothetical protein
LLISSFYLLLLIEDSEKCACLYGEIHVPKVAEL